jgi:serpin B
MQAELKPMLAALGMPTAFGDRADFSGMTQDEQLRIAAVAHEAFVAVDEAGTEAAAATGVVMRTSSAPRTSVELTVDRPFLFAIYHVETATPLFIGVVSDPSHH